MIPQWKIAGLGALGGAVLAVLVVFGSAKLGLFPQPGVNGTQLRAWLLDHPGIVTDMMARASAEQDAQASREQQALVRKVGLKTFFDPAIAFVTGPTNARATLVEFFDYNCPYCRASIPALKKYYEAHKADTRFSFIEFPIKGPNSIVAARAGLASRKQPDKYLAFHFMLMNEEGLITDDIVFADAAKAGLDVARLKADMADPAIDHAIDTAHHLALSVKIDGTPTFLFNGRLRAGAVDDETLQGVMAGKAI
jgi:protein-disulfide isomerase